MWSVWPATDNAELGPNRTASRAALGGITIGLAGLMADLQRQLQEQQQEAETLDADAVRLGGKNAGQMQVTFAAEQRIGMGWHAVCVCVCLCVCVCSGAGTQMVNIVSIVNIDST